MRFQQAPGGMMTKLHGLFIFIVLHPYLLNNQIDIVGFYTLNLLFDWICNLFMSFDWKDFREFID